MAGRINRRRRAKADVDRIWANIATENIEAAEELLDRFSAIFDLLVRNPHAGRRRPDLGIDLRSFVVEKYVVFYIPRSTGIEVVRILHGSQDVKPADMT